MATFDEITQIFNAKKNGTGWKAKCPCHDDAKASLCLNPSANGATLIKCQAGCDTKEVLASKGLTFADISSVKPNKEPKFKIIAEYDYFDENGSFLFQTVRSDQKEFRQRRRDPDKYGEWIPNIEGVKRVPYRLPEVKDAIRRKAPIFIVEGEKDVKTLDGLKLVATTNPMGAGKWTDDYSAYLKGAELIVIFPDNDEPGRKHAASITQSLRRVGVDASIKIVELPGLPEKGDVSDYIGMGHTKDDLKALVSAAPLWNPNELPDLKQLSAQTELSTANRLMDRFKLLKVTDLENRTPITYLDSDEIPTRSFVVTYGDSGVGKTHIRLRTALMIAQHAPVIYLAAEGAAGIVVRVKAICQHYKLSNEHFHIIENAVNLLDQDNVDALITAIAPVKPAYIVLDTLARCMVGGDENSSRDMGIAIAAIDSIIRATDATVDILHHRGKNGVGERGSTALRGAADMMIEITSNEGLISIACSKSKNAAEFEPRYMRLLPVIDSVVAVPASKVIVDANKLTPFQIRLLETLNMSIFADTGARIADLKDVLSAEFPKGKSVYVALGKLKDLDLLRKDGKFDPWIITDAGKAKLQALKTSNKNSNGEISHSVDNSANSLTIPMNSQSIQSTLIPNSLNSTHPLGCGIQELKANCDLILKTIENAIRNDLQIDYVAIYEMISKLTGSVRDEFDNQLMELPTKSGKSVLEVYWDMIENREFEKVGAA